VVFNTLCLYGMERSVIETFDLLRPEITPHFLIQWSNELHKTQLLSEIKKRNLSFSFLNDRWGWPRVGWPRSFKDLAGLAWSLLAANWGVFRACMRNDVIYLPVVSSAYLSFVGCLYYRILGKKVIYFFHDMV